MITGDLARLKARLDHAERQLLWTGDRPGSGDLNIAWAIVPPAVSLVRRVFVLQFLYGRRTENSPAPIGRHRDPVLSPSQDVAKVMSKTAL